MSGRADMASLNKKSHKLGSNRAMLPKRNSMAAAMLQSSCFALGLALSGGAGAVVTLDVTKDHFDEAEGVYKISLSEAVDGYTQNTWVSWSQNCPAVEGGNSGCPIAGKPNPDPNDLLFSWGAKNDPENSVLRVSFDAGVDDFTLDTISFRTPTTAVEALGPAAGPVEAELFNPPADPKQGAGTMVAYEPDLERWWGLSSGDVPHYVTDQRMDITAFDGGTPIATVENWVVPVDQSQAGVRTDATDFYVIDSSDVEGFQEYLIDQTYFFTDNGEQSDSNEPSDPKVQPRLGTGDSLEFRFYEEVWDGVAGADEPGDPDAYYGNFEIIITPLDTDPALAVRNDAGDDAGIDFGTVRAGDTSVGIAERLTASNSGDDDTTLANVTFADDLTGSRASYVVADPAAGPGPSNLYRDTTGVSQTLERTYTPGELALTDVNGVTIAAGEARQTVSADGVTDITRDITATIVGPLLGVARDADNPQLTDPASWVPYGGTINLGSVEVDGESFTSALTLANLFGTDEGASLTDLTFYNIGVTEGAGDDFFDIASGWDDADYGVESLGAFTERGQALVIRFDRDGSQLQEWTATLSFLTDQNETYQACSGVSTPGDCEALGVVPLTFQLRVIASDVPAPAVPALLGAGLAALAVVRRRRLLPRGAGRPAIFGG